MTNRDTADRFIETIGRHYDEYIRKMRAYVSKRHMEFDEEVIHLTIEKAYDTILKKGLKDDSEQGMLNYFFKAYQCNVLADLVSPYRKHMVLTDDFRTHDTYDTDDTWIGRDLRHYMAERCIEIAQEYPDEMSFLCFRLNYIMKITYKQLREITGLKDAKKRCLDVRKYVRERTSREELSEEFHRTLSEQ